jgi:predicted transcriptional regulator
VGNAATLSTRIPMKVKAGLAELAEMTDRPIAWHVNQALADYVELNRWQVRAIKKGMAELKAGRFVRHEDVMAWIESWDTDNELPVPKWKPRIKSSGRRAR